MKMILKILLLLVLTLICVVIGIEEPICPTSSNSIVQGLHYMWYFTMMLLWSCSPALIPILAFILFKKK